MARRRYLIAYDIADPQRLRAVMSLMEGYGTRLQYSVFLCDLSSRELFLWRQSILSRIKLKFDSVVVLDLGRPEANNIEVIGVPRRFPRSGPVIV